MITDEERREIASRLRKLHLGGGSKDLIQLTLTDAIGAWHENGMSWDYITERLADLIDPPQEESRVLPEGIEWPCYEDGKELNIGDTIITSTGEKDILLQVFLGKNEYGLYGEYTEEYFPYGTPVNVKIINSF